MARAVQMWVNVPTLMPNVSLTSVHVQIQLMSMKWTLLAALVSSKLSKPRSKLVKAKNKKRLQTLA